MVMLRSSDSVAGGDKLKGQWKKMTILPVVWSLLVLAEFQSLVTLLPINSGRYQVTFSRAGLYCIQRSVPIPSDLQCGMQECLEDSIA